MPLDRLLSEGYLANRAAGISGGARLDLCTGDPLGTGADLGSLLMEMAARPDEAARVIGEPTFADLPEIEGDTCHLDVADRWGYLVSATPSGGLLQSLFSTLGRLLCTPDFFRPIVVFSFGSFTRSYIFLPAQAPPDPPSTRLPPTRSTLVKHFTG